MRNLKTKTATAMSALGAGLLLATMMAGPASAGETVAASPTLTQSQIADASPATAAPAKADVIGIDLAPRTIKVTNHGGKKVTVQAKGQKARTINPKTKNSPATFRKLTAGKTYTVSVDGKNVAKTRVLAAPGMVYNMVVQTVEADPGSVLMTWQYKDAPKSGKVHFELIATPIAGQEDTTVVKGEVPLTETEGLLSGLNPHTLYKFEVEAVNDAAAGTEAKAVMTRTLGDLTGADEAAQAAAKQAAQQAAAKAAEQAAAQRAAEAAAAQQSSGGDGGGAVKPSGSNTRTIWECPSGFDDVGGVCTQTKDYTFTKSTETSPYTYHDKFVETNRIWHDDEFNPFNGCAYTVHGDRCKGWEIQGYNTKEKDAAPDGWTDNGSAYEREVEKKDATPDGWSDNGSQWVKTTAKVSREVPA